MLKTVTIKLSEPIVGHEGPITEVELRSPNLMEYARIGEPATWVKAGEDRYLSIDNDHAVEAYVQACVVEPKDKLLLNQIGLADGMAIKDAILDFFGEARRARLSPTSPTS
jgi:hypothetical protein